VPARSFVHDVRRLAGDIPILGEAGARAAHRARERVRPPCADGSRQCDPAGCCERHGAARAVALHCEDLPGPT
jgi:hypothetical protein